MSQPGSFAETVKARADIAEIIGSYIQLSATGVNRKARCAFHSEKSASLNVNVARQIWHCFGCQAGGDVFSFVQKIEGVEFPEAVRIVAQKCGIPIPEETSPGPEARERRALYSLFADASAHFSQSLYKPEAQAAREYLQRRGIDAETAKGFGFGFVPAENPALKAKFPECYDRGGFFGIRGRIALPIHDEAGRAVGFKARALGDARPKYLNTPDSPIAQKANIVFNLSRAKRFIREFGCVLIVEGEFDAIAAWRAGIKNVVASSTASLTEQQIKILARNTRKAVLCYDPDEAGVRGTERALQALLSEGFDVSIVRLPAGEDPDSVVSRYGGDAFRKFAEAAIPFLEFLFTRIEKAKTKASAVAYLAPFLRSVSDLIARSELCDQVAARLGVNRDHVRAALKKPEPRREPAEKSSCVLPMLEAEKRLLQILIANEALRFPVASAIQNGNLFSGLPTECFIPHFTKPEGFDVGTLYDALDESQRLYMKDIVFESAGPGDSAEAQSCLDALFLRKLRNQMLDVKQRMAVPNLDEATARALASERFALQREFQRVLKKS